MQVNHSRSPGDTMKRRYDKRKGTKRKKIMSTERNETAHENQQVKRVQNGDNKPRGLREKGMCLEGTWV